MEGVYLSHGNVVEHSIHFGDWNNIGRKEIDRARQAVFYTPPNPSGNDPDEKKPHDDYTVPQKVHYETYWKHNQDAVYWIKLSRAQDQALRFWQTRSFAIITYTTVPGDCIVRVTSQNGDRVIFEKLATPRPAPKVTLKSNWQIQKQQQQQPQQPTLLARVRDDTKHAMEVERASRKLVLASSEAEADIHLTGKEALTDTNTTEIERIKIGCPNKICIREDLAKEKMVFGGVSSHAIFELGNVELFELKKSSIQCPLCIHYVLKGTCLCNCG